MFAMKYLIIVFSMIPYCAFSQLTLAWQECYGTSESDYLSDAISTTDSGILVSATYGGTDGDAEGQDSLLIPALLLKFDTSLSLIWQKSFGGATGISVFNVLTETEDGIVCGGYTKAVDGDFIDNNGGSDLMIVKTDLLGNKLWSYCYGGPFDDYLVGMTEVSDGGYIVTGYSHGAGGDIPIHYGDALSADVCIMKLNSNGELQWLKVFGGSFIDAPLVNPLEVDTGIYQIHIYAASDDFDLQDCGVTDIQKRWIVEINNDGDIVKQSFMSAEDDFLRSDGQLLQLDNKQTLMVGTGNAASTLFPAPEGHLFEEGAIAIFDSNLTMIYMRQWGGSGIDKLVRCKKDLQGNYYFLGFSSSNNYDLPANYNDGFNYDYWLLKTDSLYNLVWSENFGGSSTWGDIGGTNFTGNFLLNNSSLFVFSSCVVPESIPDFDILCGHEPSNYIFPYTDAWLLKFDIGTAISEYNQEIETFDLYPNPVHGLLTIDLNSNFLDLTINVYQVTSNVIYSDSNVSSSKIEINTDSFPNGIYLLTIYRNNKLLFSDKIIVQH